MMHGGTYKPGEAPPYLRRPKDALDAGALAPGGMRGGRSTGLNPIFGGELEQFRSAAHAAGHDIGIGSGFRSEQRQRELYARAVAKYGPERARHWVAPPGHSMHNVGLAADLTFGDPGAREWAHAHAGEYGLRFRMGHEPWHIEPTAGRNLAAVHDAPGQRRVAAGDPAQAQHAAVDLPTGGPTGIQTAGGGEGRDVHVYIHMDPSFPGQTSTHGSPGIVVRRTE
jgi:hypothetical protein